MKTMTIRKAAVSLAVTAAMLISVAQASEPNWRATPAYETVNLTAGFLPDPWTRTLQAGGSTEATRELGPGCTGYINFNAPDVDLNYTPGRTHLYIHVESDADTTLVVYGPDRRWYCNDDFGSLNPMVVFHNPPQGNYNIWVGRHGSSELVPATLKITEINPIRRQ